MANNLLNIAYITNEGLPVLDNELVVAGKVNRQYSDQFAKTGAKIGYTVNARRPPRYVGTFGPGLNVEDTNETYIPVTLNTQFHVDVQFTTPDLLLAMDQFSTRVLQPAMKPIFNRVDSDTAFFGYQNTPNSVGVPGTPPASFLGFAIANSILTNEAAGEERNVILDPLSTAYAADGVKGLFNPQSLIGDYVTKGMVSKNYAGMDFYQDANIVTFTTGAQGGTPLLTANTSGAFLTSGWADSGFIQTNGWTNSTGVVKVGDVIQIAGVYPVNPQSRAQYGNALKQFVVLPPGGYTQQPNGASTGPGLAFAASTLTSGTFNAATGVYTSSGGGALSIKIGECVISGGQFQNCTTTSAFTSTSAITVNGGTANASKVSPQGLALDRNAIALVFADLPLPRGVHEAARSSDPDLGMSVRMVTQYTINNDALPTRIDVLYGLASLYRQLAVRIAG